jgi:predicted DNA-binding protein
MVTVRLPDEMEAQLQTLTEIENSTKTDVIKSALAEYLEKHLREKTPYDLGKDLFGRYSSGDTDRSATYKDRVKKSLNEKHAH